MLEFLNSHHQSMTFASNITWMLLSFLTAWVMLKGMVMLNKTKPDHWWTMLGVFLVALSASIHRAYWSVWTWHLSHGRNEEAAEWAEYKGLLTPLIFMLGVGYLCHLRPLFSAKIKNHWWSASIGITLTLWMTAVAWVNW